MDTDKIKIYGNIFICFVEAGVLGLPYAFKESGILEGLIVTLFISFFSVKSMLLLVDCRYKCLSKMGDSEDNSQKMSLIKNAFENESDELNSDEYNSDDSKTLKDKNSRNHKLNPHKNLKLNSSSSDIQITYYTIANQVLGRFGGWTVDILVIVSQLGSCCAYLIFISENATRYLLKCDHEVLNGTEYKNCEEKLTFYSNNILLCLMLPLVFLSQIRNLDRLAIFSLMAGFTNIFAYLTCLIVFWFDFEHVQHVKVEVKEMDFKGLPFFVSASMYLYGAAGMVLPLEDSLPKEHRPHFKTYFRNAVACIVALELMFGISGYLSFGETTESIITFNLPEGVLLLPDIIKFCLCIALIFTYPVMIFPVTETLEQKFSTKPGLFIGSLIRLISPILTWFIVKAIPSFSAIMGLIGATTCTLLLFILPPILHFLLHRQSIPKKAMVLDLFLVCLGVVSAVVGTRDAVYRIRAAHE